MGSTLLTFIAYKNTPGFKLSNQTKHLSTAQTIQSNLSTRVSHGELQKLPLITGGLCSERNKLSILFSRDKL